MNALMPSPIPPVPFRKNGPKRMMRARERKMVDTWYSMIPSIESAFPGLVRAPSPEGHFGSLLVDWWVTGTYQGRPLDVFVETGVSTPTYAISVSGMFRDAPIGREREREVPTFYLGNSLSRYRRWIGNAPAGIGAYLTLSDLLRVMGRSVPPPETLVGLSSQYILYSNYPKMERALRSEVWMRPFQIAEQLVGGGEPLDKSLLVAFGFSTSFRITIPLDVVHSGPQFLPILKLLMVAVATLEASFDAEPISQVPLAYDRERTVNQEQIFPKVICPACGNLEQAILAFEPTRPPRPCTNTMTDRCHAVIYYRPPNAPRMTNLSGGLPL